MKGLYTDLNNMILDSNTNVVTRHLLEIQQLLLQGSKVFYSDNENILQGIAINCAKETNRTLKITTSYYQLLNKFI